MSERALTNSSFTYTSISDSKRIDKNSGRTYWEDFSTNNICENKENPDFKYNLETVYLQIKLNRRRSSDSNISQFSCDKIRKYRKIGSYKDIYSKRKNKNNLMIFKMANAYLKNDDIHALILDGPLIRSSKMISKLKNLKKITIIEGVYNHYKSIKNKIQKIPALKKKFKVIYQNIYDYLNVKFDKRFNLIYLDINANFFKCGEDNQLEAGKYAVKKILERIGMKKVIFAMTFSLRNPIKNFLHKEHEFLINQKLKAYFNNSGFTYESMLDNTKSIYSGNSGYGKLYFNIFLLKKINLMDLF